jgi:hypothetical protein
MKKLLSFAFTLLAVSIGFSQSLTVGAPANTGGTTTSRAPNGTTAHTALRGHIIITAAEMSSISAGTTFTGLGFLYFAGASTAATGNIKFYLENTSDVTNTKSLTWSTAIASMTQVCNGSYTIPAVAGPTNIATTSTFTYTGGGLYVAYDYLGSTFATTAASYYCEYLAVPGGTKVEPSATTTPPATLVGSSNWRPEIQFTFANPYTNNMAVDGVFAGKGQDNLLLGTTQVVAASVKNISSVALTNVPVSLSITGANPYTATQTVASIAAGATASVNFTAVPKTNTGVQTVVVSVPPDQQTSNDSFTLTQNIYCDTVGYAFGNTITGGLGYNTGTGIFANLLVLPAGGPKYIKTVIPTLATGTELVGNTIKGVLLNTTGLIIDSTASHTIVTANLGQPVPLAFINGSVNHAGDSVYYGFRQVANATTGYFPLATQELTGTIVPADLFCGFATNGGGYANFTQYGVAMMAAKISAVKLTTNAINGGICQATPLNLSVAGGYPTYTFSTNGSVAQTGAGTTYSYTPTATTTAQVQTTIGTCTYTDTKTVTQIAPVTSSISHGLCPGSNYNFNGLIINSAGTYIDTVPSYIGCDSIITLTVTNISSVTNNISASICQGTTYAFGGQNLSAAGAYADTLPTSAGCDSIINLTLSVNMPSSASVTKTLCAASYQFGGQNLTTSGTYTNTLTNAAGCDSVITLSLTLNPVVSVTVAQSGSILTATATPATATLQWVSCPALTPIAGATASTFQPTTVVGNYAVVAVGTAGCGDTSTCTTIDMTGMDELDLSATIILYPNPSVDVVHVASSASPIVGYKVYDVIGRTVLNTTIEGGSTEVKFSVDGFDNGMYKIEVYTQENTITKTFVKK